MIWVNIFLMLRLNASELNSYRPISNLSFLLKLIEHCVAMIEHCVAIAIRYVNHVHRQQLLHA